MTNLVTPRILVLEGLYADTTDIIDDCGGIGIEASPWNETQVKAKLKSGAIDGFLLTGGTDVDPWHYGEKPCPMTQTPDYTRDRVELMVLDHARKNRLPVLGICRGSQIMCVARGGSLVQDVQLYTDAFERHNGTHHTAHATDKANTFRRACLGDTIEAISLHHQCVREPGHGMRIAARAIDGTPEAIESKDGLWLGVQFHPEMSAYENPSAFAIFRWLVEAAARRKGGKAKATTFRKAVECHDARKALAYHSFKKDAGHDYYWPYDDDYEDFEIGTTTAAPTRTTIPQRTSPHRKAGDSAIPSMRAPSTSEMVRLIESSTGQSVTVTDHAGNVIDSTCEEDDSCPFDCAKAQVYPTETPRSEDVDVSRLEMSLRICPACHIYFDCIEDCDDHKKFVHPQGAETDQTWHQRFADMQEPPAGDPAWEADDEQLVKMARDGGFEPSDWDACVD